MHDTVNELYVADSLTLLFNRFQHFQQFIVKGEGCSIRTFAVIVTLLDSAVYSYF